VDVNANTNILKCLLSEVPVVKVDLEGRRSRKSSFLLLMVRSRFSCYAVRNLME
jgi:hypothetical protein